MPNNFHDIFIDTLEKHLLDFSFHNTPRDQSQYERIITTFELTNPVEKAVYSKDRKINIIFQFAEFLWYISGDNSLDYISYYSSNMNKYSMDGKTLTGTAYGKSFGHITDGISNLEKIIDLLKKEPNSKRAVLQIYKTDELFIKNNLDVSCTLALQFLLRDNNLNLISFMRANDAYVGMVSDVFSFTLLQEYVANRLNAELGTYYHIVGSTHIYEKDYLKAKDVIQNKKPFSFYKKTFPKMPKEGMDDSLKVVLEYEKKLRNNLIRINEHSLKNLSIDDYYKDIIYLFELKREMKNGEPLNKEIISRLNPTIQYLFLNRFGE